MKNIAIILLLFTYVGINTSYAYIGPNQKKLLENERILSTREDCQPGLAQTDLDVNNVRARLLTGGDLWWDLSNGKYIVPKPAPGFKEVSALYAGGVWIGGVDPAGSLKLAGVTYRRGNTTDFYPGPLDDDGQTESEVCSDWDRFFRVYGKDVLAHGAKALKLATDGTEINCDSIPDEVKYWPGRGNPYWKFKYDFDLPDQELGYFHDFNEDGIYNPCDGDIPAIEIRDCYPEGETKIERLKDALSLVPDEMIFWVYNDNGGPHRLTLATAIQMEVQVQAFAYATNDEINDMTFYRYKLINKAKDDLRDCYFAMWVDPDLGCSVDDYVGCDVERSLAYVYNEDAVDGQTGESCPGGVNTYGKNIPMIGIDYFRGPRGPKVFSINGGDTTLVNPTPGSGDQDTLVELGMTSFIYMNRSDAGDPPDATTDPDRDFEFYNYLRGFWKTGEIVSQGGSGYNPGSTDSVKYVFPGRPNVDTEWSMCSANLPFGDRRTLQATGPLLLQPGATNELIIGAVFVPDVPHPCPSISKLQFADDLAQALFDNCFDIVDGPDSPDMYGIELDRQLVLILSNDSISSNNKFETYQEVDLKAPESVEDKDYKFEGYKVYQLANPNVTSQEINDPEKARLIRQVDLKNGVTDIYNWFPVDDPNPENNSIVYVPRKMVEGGDKGISHSFNVLEDAFATADSRLVNHKNYYFMTIAYAYNNYEQYLPSQNVGQRTPYLEGRRVEGHDDTRIYTFTPRPMLYSDLQTAYGDGPEVTRISGAGTGLNALDVKEGMYDIILSEGFDGRITYKKGMAPIDIKVVDPITIKDGKYRLEITGDYKFNSRDPKYLEGARWTLLDVSTGDVIASEKSIDELNEQIIYQKGFSIAVNQVDNPGDDDVENSGFIAQAVEYKDASKANWWRPINPSRGINVDINGNSVPFFQFAQVNNENDEGGSFVNQCDNFAPLELVTYKEDNNGLPNYSPGYQKFQNLATIKLEHLNNVDVVFTSDKSKWSRCVVVESANYVYGSVANEEPIGNAGQFNPRKSQSVGKDGQPDGTGLGMGWFPGYAIDVETGQRLNIFFGENSVYRDALDDMLSEPGKARNGDDMIFNPTGDLLPGGYTLPTPNVPFSWYGGGQHFIYVTRQPYDECNYLQSALQGSNGINAEALSLVTWTAWPLTSTPFNSVEEGLIPNDVTVKLRVTNSYNKELKPKGNNNTTRFDTIAGNPVYEFEFKDVEKRKLEEAQFDEALAKVAVVPNPYYAYSTYENSQFSKEVRITNLPAKAVITIYSLDGKFIRQITVDESETRFASPNPAVSSRRANSTAVWDLNNSRGIPVASGAYLFHIDAPELGSSRTIKWFGINRKFDPSGL